MKMLKTKWEFERAQLLATGATSKGLSESHSGLRLNPAAVHKVLCPWEPILSLPGVVLLQGALLLSLDMCCEHPLPCSLHSAVMVPSPVRTRACWKSIDLWNTWDPAVRDLSPERRDWHPAVPHSKFLSLVPTCSATSRSITKVSKLWCEENCFDRLTLATNTSYSFLEFAIFLLCILAAHKKYYLHYKVVTILFLCFIFSANFSLIPLNWERPQFILWACFSLFFLHFFFRGLTHSYVCNKTLSLSKEQVSILKTVRVCTSLATVILTLQYFIGTS